jgi:16S rRNA (cytosine1402-N4)-methyltransferase
MVIPVGYEDLAQGKTVFHVPVLAGEVINYLAPKDRDIVVDGTVGLGGHAQNICRHIAPGGFLIAIDKDEVALRHAEKNLAQCSLRKVFVKDGFEHLDTILSGLGVKEVRGILLDLGLSSLQLEDDTRGFSFNKNGPLDMRFDVHSSRRAYDIVNRAREEELADILHQFGEERFARKVAKAICRARDEGPLATTGALKDVIARSIGRHYHGRHIHCATRTFQALRIAVNDELRNLEKALTCAVTSLARGGRICVISYHSLEDRIVKQFFKGAHAQKIAAILTKKPVRPREDEIADNPRARSAKLRALEKA